MNFLLSDFNAIPFKFASKWISKLYFKLEQIRERRKSELDHIGDIFGDPFEISKYYVEPDCQQFNPANDDEDEDESSHFVHEPIFRRLESFFDGEGRKGKHQLFLLSDAGMGKTSLLVMLKLANISSFSPPEYDCLLYKLGTNTLQELSRITGRRNKILLLDALDEDPLALGRVKERIIELLKETENFRRVLITCRTQFFSAGEDPFNRRGQVTVGPFLCPVLYNSLFTKEQISIYIKKRFKDSNNLDEKLNQTLSILRNMGSLKCRPMLLSHIEDFLEANRPTWNEFTIYKTLITVWLLREHRKKLERGTLRATFDDLIHACRLLALNLQCRGAREISEDDLTELISRHPLLNQIPTIDIKGRSLLNKTSNGSFRFSHYSIQEFLVVDGSLNGTFDLSNEKIARTAQMRTFLAAWLSDNEREGNVPSDLAEYKLHKMNFSGSVLSGLNLRNIDLQQSDLRNADLSFTQLQWAKLNSTDLRGANLSSAKLHWADFTNAKYDHNTIWPSLAPDGAVRY